jgi:hypothetical protein
MLDKTKNFLECWLCAELKLHFLDLPKEFRLLLFSQVYLWTVETEETKSWICLIILEQRPILDNTNNFFIFTAWIFFQLLQTWIFQKLNHDPCSSDYWRHINKNYHPCSSDYYSKAVLTGAISIKIIILVQVTTTQKQSSLVPYQ